MNKNIFATALALTVLAQSVQAQTTLTFGSGSPGPAPINAEIQAWVDEVTAASEGTLEINFRPGGVMGKSGQLYDRVLNGVVDIAWDLPAVYAGRFPNATVAELPGLYEDSGIGSVALQRIFESGQLGEEFSDVKILALFVFATPTLMTAEPVEGIDDLRGLEITTTTASRQQMLSELGATPVTLPIFEWYQGLNRSLIDGIVETMSIVPAFRLSEVAPNYIELPMGGSTGMIFMDASDYEALPEAARSALDANSGVVLARRMGDFWQDAADDAVSMVNGQGLTVRTLPERELERFRTEIAPVTSEWVAETPNGAAILDAFQSAIAGES